MWQELHPTTPVICDDENTTEIEGPPRTKTFLQAAVQIAIADLSMVLGILSSNPIRLIEPRRLRADFLSETAEALGLTNVSVDCARVERVRGQFDVITARAVAQLDRFLAMADHLSNSGTVWVLPKGKNAQSELAQARLNWHCDVSVEQSRTDPESQILVLTRVGAKKKR